jgi:uncharacterized membrane protein
MPGLHKTLLSLLTVAYPFAVFYGAHFVAPRYLVLLLVVVALLRLLSWQSGPLSAGLGWQVLWLVVILLLVALSWLGNNELGLKLYPVVVNSSLLVVFAASLWQSQSLVERMARWREPDLPPSAVVYTRKVTQVWCVFFAVNGALATYTALFSSRQVWLLYNGLLAYVLIATLMAVEWLVRRRVRARG